MANVSWSNPGTSGDWSSTTHWAGLTGGESYPGSSLGDSVTIGGSNSTYVVTFDVSTATISSLDIEGGNGSVQSSPPDSTVHSAIISISSRSWRPALPVRGSASPAKQAVKPSIVVLAW